MIRPGLIALGLLVGAAAPPATAPHCPARPVHWSGPKDHGHLLANVISLKRHGGLAWNDKAVSEPAAREYLKVASSLLPKPGIVLKYEDGVPCSEVARFRQMIAKIYGCDGSSCNEGGFANQ